MKLKGTLLAAALLAGFGSLALPAASVSAQGGYDPYYGRRDDNRNRRRNDDDYDRREGRTRGDSRYVRDAVKRLEDNSDGFRNVLDRALDNSRYDESRREDRILDVAGEFEEATDDLSESYRNRNVDEKVRRVLDLGSRLDRFVSRNRLDGRTEGLWSQIRQDLRTVADAYGFRSGGIFDDNRNTRRYPNDRRDNRRNSGIGGVLGDIFGNRY